MCKCAGRVGGEKALGLCTAGHWCRSSAPGPFREVGVRDASRSNKPHADHAAEEGSKQHRAARAVFACRIRRRTAMGSDVLESPAGCSTARLLSAAGHYWQARLLLCGFTQR